MRFKNAFRLKFYMHPQDCPEENVNSRNLNSHKSPAKKIEYSMRHFVPRQAIIYNYFQIMKNHGYINDVIVYQDNKRYRIGIEGLAPKTTHFE